MVDLSAFNAFQKLSTTIAYEEPSQNLGKFSRMGNDTHKTFFATLLQLSLNGR